MCAPLIAAVGAFAASSAGTATLLGLTAASGGLALYGNAQQAKSQQRSANYEAQVADINAARADSAARDALERGDLDAVQHGRQVAALRGQQTVGFAQTGLEGGFGTPVDIASDTALLAAEDTRNIYQNANREAEGYRINASNYRADATGSRAASAASKSQMIIDAGSTVLSTATKLGGQWAKYGKRS